MCAVTVSSPKRQRTKHWQHQVEEGRPEHGQVKVAALGQAHRRHLRQER